ncbi:MAG: SBBP repeat-containing protein [Kofleriaceae bacterium]
MRYLCVLAVFAMSCGDDAANNADAMIGDDGGGDAAIDGSVDAPTCGGAGSAEMLCSGACVDTSSDPDHCGDCMTECTGATPACAAGDCVSPLSTAWVKHYGGAEFGNGISAVATDGAGNVYVTGYFFGTINLGGTDLVSSGIQEIVVASFAPDGTHRWSTRFGGVGSDQGAGMTVVGGKVYVTGSYSMSVDFGGGVRTSAGFGDIFLLVLSAADGSYVADRVYGDVDDDAGLDVVVDANGNVTFGGFFNPGSLSFGGGNSITTLAFSGFIASIDATGAHRWSRRLGGNTAADISSMQSLAIDAAGNVAIALEFEGTDDFGDGMQASAGNNFDALVASYTPAGALRWKRQFGAAQSDTAESIAIDSAGNVLVGGGFHGTVNFGAATLVQSGVIDGWAAILDGASGTPRWARKIGSASSSAVRAVAFDPDDNAIISATIEGATDLGTGALTMFDEYDIMLADMGKAAGATTFAKIYGGDDFEGGNAMAITNGGAIVLGGYFRTTVDLGLPGPTVGGMRDNAFVMLIAR